MYVIDVEFDKSKLKLMFKINFAYIMSERSDPEPDSDQIKFGKIGNILPELDPKRLNRIRIRPDQKPDPQH